MSLLNVANLQDEIVNFARSLIKDKRGREATTSESFNGTGAKLAFVLTNKATCINSVTVSSVAQKWGVNYTYNGNNKTVTFTVAPGVGTNNVVINYDYLYSWGWWGYPSVGIKPEIYPAFGIIWLGGPSSTSDMSGSNLETNLVFRVFILSNDVESMSGSDTVKELIDEFRSDFFSKTDWYHDGKSQGRTIPLFVPDEPKIDSRRSGRVFSGFIDFEIPFIQEVKV